MKQPATLTPIGSQPYLMRCPHCRAAIAEVRPQGRPSVLGGGYLYHDGDSLMGLHGPLIDSGKEPDWCEGSPWKSSFDASIEVARCLECGEACYVVQVEMVDAEKVCYAFEDGFFHNNDVTPERVANFAASLPGVAKGHWLVSESMTEYGVAHTHSFGPFRFGPRKPGAGFGGQQVFEIWDHLRAACRDANTRERLASRPINKHWAAAAAVGWAFATDPAGDRLRIVDLETGNFHGDAWNPTDMGCWHEEFHAYAKYARGGTCMDRELAKVIEECPGGMAWFLENAESKKVAEELDKATPAPASMSMADEEATAERSTPRL